MIIRAFSPDIEVRTKENRTREFIISNERPDSHRTVLRIAGWDIEDYNRAGAVYFQHLTASDNVNNALGVGRAYIEGKNLIGSATFEPKELNPLADIVMGKIDHGTYKRTSVGFMPKKGKGHWGKEDRGEDPTLYYFEGQTLVEFSIVDIGSNLDAVKKSMESMDKYLADQIDEHESKGFQKDFKRSLGDVKRHLEYLHNLAERRNIF